MKPSSVIAGESTKSREGDLGGEDTTGSSEDGKARQRHQDGHKHPHEGSDGTNIHRPIAKRKGQASVDKKSHQGDILAKLGKLLAANLRDAFAERDLPSKEFNDANALEHLVHDLLASVLALHDFRLVLGQDLAEADLGW